MRTTRIVPTLILFTALGVGTGYALDAETQALETQVLCQTVPARCPDFQARAVEAQATERRCQGLLPQMTLLRSKRSHHERLTTAEEQAEDAYRTACNAWEYQQRLGRLSPPTSYSSTLDCVTTTDDSPYSSRLTTTCTLH